VTAGPTRRLGTDGPEVSAIVLRLTKPSAYSEYHARYDRYSASAVGHITGPAAHAVTIR
jgi:hypothetical protein